MSAVGNFFENTFSAVGHLFTGDIGGAGAEMLEAVGIGSGAEAQGMSKEELDAKLAEVDKMFAPVTALSLGNEGSPDLQASLDQVDQYFRDAGIYMPKP